MHIVNRFPRQVLFRNYPAWPGLLSLGQGNNNMAREGKQEGIDGGESSQDRLTLMLGLIVDLR